MKATVALLIVVFVILGGLTVALAADLKDKVKVEISSVGLRPDMDPGLYVCAGGHLHIRGTVQNLANVALSEIKVAGKAFDTDGRLLGTATSSTKEAILRPREKAEINLEFLSVTGPRVQLVKKHEVTVIEAPVKR